MEHSLRGRRNPGSSNQPSSQTLIPYKILFVKHKTYQNMGKFVSNIDIKML